jgi:hypothetical protein
MNDVAWRARFPKRTVHLDFHTGPDVPDVGIDFDPDRFARTFADAHVDSVTVFAKCHHGHLYYETERPERHPGLRPHLDLLGEQVDALHKVGIRAPIYLSVQCDEFAANHHPGWIALKPAGTQVRMGPESVLEAGWQILDMSSPYQDYLAEQLSEVLDRFAPVDGIFLDMCWNQESCSIWARDGMEAKHLDPKDAANRAEYARLVAHLYMERFSTMVEPALVPGSASGTWFNSRPKAELVGHHAHLHHVEVESLPTGGWGYSYLPYVGRLVRTLGLPVLSHTGRFHRSWGDASSLKHEAALKYECSQILLHGLTNGVGDLLPPSGAPDQAVYDRIGKTFAHIKACEPYLEGAHHVTEVALVVDPATGDSPPASVIGALRGLQQLRHQFDVVSIDADLALYEVVVVPEDTPVDAGLQERLLEHVGAGRGLIVAASGPTSAWIKELGFEVEGTWPYDPVFLNLTRSELVEPAPGIRVRVGGDSVRLAAPTDGETLVGLDRPYFQRSYRHFSGHGYTPPAGPTGYGAVVAKENTVVLAVPLFSAIASDANQEYLEVLDGCLRRLLPTPLLRTSGPLHLETAVVGSEQHTAVHLLSFLPTRAGQNLDLVRDPFPLVDLRVDLRSEVEPSRATLQPMDTPLALTYKDGYASVVVTLLDGHALVVFDH